MVRACIKTYAAINVKCAITRFFALRKFEQSLVQIDNVRMIITFVLESEFSSSCSFVAPVLLGVR